MIGDDDDVLDFEDDDPRPPDLEDPGPSTTTLLENIFGVDEDGGEIVMTKRPGSRLDVDDALNLAAWIVAASGVDLADFEELVRSAVEGVE